MGAVTVVAVLMMAGALADIYNDRLTENEDRIALENILLDGLRKKLMRDNLDYDSATNPTPSTSVNVTATTRTHTTTKATNVVTTEKYVVNTFRVIYRSSSDEFETKRKETLNDGYIHHTPRTADDPLNRSNPEYDLEDDVIVSPQASTPLVVRVKKPSLLHQRLQPYAHKRSTTKQPSEKNLSKRQIWTSIPDSGDPAGFRWDLWKQKTRTKLPNSQDPTNFQSRMYENVEQYSAYRYVPTTKHFTVSLLISFNHKTSPASDSNKEVRELQRKHNYRPDSPYNLFNEPQKRFYRLVQPTPHTRSTRSTTIEDVVTFPTLQRRYWTVRTRNPLYKEPKIVDKIHSNKEKPRDDSLDLEEIFKAAVSRALTGIKFRSSAYEGQWLHTTRNDDVLPWKYVQL